MSQRRSKTRAQRGLSTAELLSVVVVLSLALATIAVVTGPLVRAPAEAQAKVDTVASAAQGLYRLQRDVRETDANGIWICTNSATPSCSQPFLTQTATVIALASARDATGQFLWDANSPSVDKYSGYPTWQGVWVYWLAADSTNPGAFDVRRAYEPLSPPFKSGQPGLPTQTQVQNAVAAALALTNPDTVQHSVSTFAIEAGASNTVAVQIATLATAGGHQNATTYRSDTLSRNQ